MTTTTTATRTNGAGTIGARPVLEPPRRRVRPPEVLVGVGFAVAFALASVLWHLSTTERQAVLALARPVARGEVVKAGDLRVVYLASDDAIAHLSRTDSARVVGRPAGADLPAGTLLTAASVTSAPTLGDGEGVVGLSLEPGQVPVAELVPGDLVDVVAATEAAPATTTGEAPPPLDANPEPAAIATGATVYAVAGPSVQGKRVVSIKLAKPEATRVAAAAERGGIRLVLVGRP